MLIYHRSTYCVLATAFIEKTVFDEFKYTHPDDDGDGVNDITALEFPLDTLIECLNIFGSATGSVGGQISQKKRWKKPGEESGDDDNVDEQNDRPGRSRENGKIDQYFANKSGKSTGMKLSYIGEGYPLTLLL